MFTVFRTSSHCYQSSYIHIIHMCRNAQQPGISPGYTSWTKTRTRGTTLTWIRRSVNLCLCTQVALQRGGQVVTKTGPNWRVQGNWGPSGGGHNVHPSPTDISSLIKLTTVGTVSSSTSCDLLWFLQVSQVLGIILVLGNASNCG